MKPRVHNLVSYCGAFLVFALVLGWRWSTRQASWQPSLALSAGASMWLLHFARRAAESAWVHRYAKPGVPLGDVLVEYVYYWGFALWNALSLSSPNYHGPTSAVVLSAALVFGLAELGNARAHRMLRDLRAPGSAARVVPRGFLFEHVSCPHYLCEILSWVGFALATQTWAALGFLLVGSGILAAWARTRHLAYLKEFDGSEGRELYPSTRRALIPGIF
ncbi:MAG TPA: hypothetical protein VFQ61_15320 [Polyangiaceae bacterium]|nr:hypothetical protein [Polyangiaceae bacterium]